MDKGDWRSASSARRGAAHTAALLTLLCIATSHAHAADRNPLRTSDQRELVRLPVVDGRDIRFLRFSVEEPPRSRIRGITQDDYGFLWLATASGLYRYDGYNLKHYLHEPGDPASLSADRVFTVYKARDGALWIGTASGLDRLDPTRDGFTRYGHDPTDERSLSGAANVVHQDRDGVLWVGTSRGLDRMDPSTGDFTHYRHDPRDDATLSNSAVLALHEDRRGNLWVGTTAGLNVLEKATGRITRFRHDPADPHSLGHDYVGAIAEDRAGVLWFASSFGSGLSALDVKTGRFTRYSFHAEEEVTAQGETGANGLYVDRDGVLWLCTLGTGLLKLDPDRKRFVRYARDPTDSSTLPSDTVLTVFEDAEGVMWVGTQSGVAPVIRKPPPFVNYMHRGTGPDSLTDDMIRSVLGDSHGDLWIGTETGLQRLDRRTRRLTLYRHDPKNPDSLSCDKVSAIREDPSGALWIGTLGGGLDRFDAATGRFVHYRHDPSDPRSLDKDLVLSVFFDRNGVLWVGTQAGALSRFDRASGRFTVVRSSGRYSVRSIFEDRAGILWLAGNDGLTRFDPRAEQFTVLSRDPADPRSISNDEVWTVHEDRQGRLWVGTDAGLNELDRVRGTFTSLTRKDGLAGNSVRAILEDGKGSLWLATDGGLSQFHPETRTFRNFTESDGLPGNLLNPYGLQGTWQSPTGEMVLGSTNGLTAFFPDRLATNSYVPPVVLTELALFNKPVAAGKDSPLSGPIWASNSLTLTHGQSIFTLAFSALSYSAPEKTRYRYRLEGFEREWNDVDSRRRQATYTRLAAGRYTLRVQASTNGEVWSEPGVRLALQVLPPWWATWWSRSVMGALALSLLIIAHRARVRTLNRKATRPERIVTLGEVTERKRVEEHLRLLLDITDRRVAKQDRRAGEAAHAKSALLAPMIHEIRTPTPDADTAVHTMTIESADTTEVHAALERLPRGTPRFRAVGRD